MVILPVQRPAEWGGLMRRWIRLAQCEGNSLLAWLSPGASPCINFRCTYCTWNISKVWGKLVMYPRFWPLPKGMSLLTFKKVVVMFEPGGILQMVVVAAPSLFIPRYLLMFFVKEYRHTKKSRGSNGTLFRKPASRIQLSRVTVLWKKQPNHFLF